MRQLKVSSINRTLFVLVLVTMIPVLGIVLFSGFEHRKSLSLDAQRNIFLTTSSMAEVQKDLTHSVRQTLTVLSLLPEVQKEKVTETSILFKSIVWQNQEYHNISLVALDGTILVSAKPYESQVTLADHKHVRQAIETRDFATGEFTLGNTEDSIPIFTYAYPVFGEKLELLYVLTASIKLDYFSSFHEFADMPENAFIAATDHQGIRLFYHPAKEDTNPVGKSINTKSWEKVQKLSQQGGKGSFAGTGSDGVSRIFAFEQVRLGKNSPAYMYVFAGIPESHVEQPARDALFRNLQLLFASIGLALFIFLLVGRKVLNEPIYRLIEITERFKRGEFPPCKEESGGPKELRVLNDTFFDMATELTENQQMVLSSELRFREIFQNMTDGVVICDPQDEGEDFIVKDINPAGLKSSMGKREEILGRTVVTALPHIFDSQFMELLKRVYITGSPGSYPVSKYVDDQVELWIESSVFKLPDGEVVVVYDDITNRKRVEQQQLESEAKFRAVIDQASDAIYVMGEKGDILLVNRRACETMGYSEEEFLQMNVTDIDPFFTQRNDIGAVWETMVEGTTSIVETSHRDKGGRVFPVEVNVGRISIGNQAVILGIVRDISARKEFEASLRQSKEDWESTFNAISDIITIQDKDMHILRANQAFHEAFPEYPTLDLTPPCYEIFHSDQQICEDCPAHRTLKDRKPHRQEVVEGAIDKIYDVVTYPIHDERGEVDRIVHIVKDVSETKKLEEELFQAHKMEAVGTLAGGIAHDFNNILSAIMGFAEFIEEDASKGSQTAQDAAEILSATSRARDLVKQILTFSRKSDRNKSVIKPQQVVEEAVNMLRSTFPTSVAIVDEIQEDCCSILANSTNLHQVVLNLCANARHAMTDDKGLLRIELREVLRNAAPWDLSREKRYVLLKVADNGCGIAHGELERIFEPYYTTREVGSGSGLGLSVTHGIVEDCNGVIEVESAPGEGSAFSVFFPCHEGDGEGENIVSPKKSRDKAQGGARILMVDDEPLLLKINSRRLLGLGYTVDMTESSVEALERISKDPQGYDLLITDQTMPELTGEDLAQEVLLLNSKLPIIVCTGHSESFSEEKALGMGIKKYVFKPVLGDELIDAVAEVLDS